MTPTGSIMMALTVQIGVTAITRILAAWQTMTVTRAAAAAPGIPRSGAKCPSTSKGMRFVPDSLHGLSASVSKL